MNPHHPPFLHTIHSPPRLKNAQIPLQHPQIRLPLRVPLTKPNMDDRGRVDDPMRPERHDVQIQRPSDFGELHHRDGAPGDELQGELGSPDAFGVLELCFYF